MVSALLSCLASGAKEARAFHSGGVGECEGCHSMHNSQSGFPAGGGGAYLLKGGDASSTCLTCHQVAGDTGPASYHISTPNGEMPFGTPPKQLSPGGDFGWLKKTYTWYADVVSPMSTSAGDRHGHNVNAQDFGFQQDGKNLTAPGGAYPSSALSCTSCHDPHGTYRRNQDGTISTSGKPIKESGSYETSSAPDAETSVGSYRMLAGTGYVQPGMTGGLAFSYAPPNAVAPSTYNRSEATSVTRVAYGSGFSDWCRNCHTNIHNGTYSFSHPAAGFASGATTGNLDATMINYYDQYIKTGDLSGTAANAYFSLVPFEVGSQNYGILKSIVTTTPTKGPDLADGTPAVMCLSCHRAHASGWDYGMRWNTKTSQITSNGKYSQETLLYQPFGQGRTEAEALQAYYQTPAVKFDPNQQGLCYKCHATLPQ
ncbi:cytochrome c [Geomonas silvestris]|uniref:Cytochrome c n=2 Tax=Geomonas silvestris TaxID=2740184 RepID=A0A6V8MKZ8_9BACT|nr:cytochrome c [Geomonas silvestris]